MEIRLLISAVASLTSAAYAAPASVYLDSRSPIVELKVMVRAGSAADPEGQEGLAYLTGRLLIEGGFGDPANPVTKERLAEITRPWGSGAYPTVRISKEATTFSAAIPKEFLAEYVREVLGPMFERPLFKQAELDRLRAEALQHLRSRLRLEAIEDLGLAALDNVLHAGTSYAHPDIGTEKGLGSVNAEAAQRFYAERYGPDNLVVGATGGKASARLLEQALSSLRAHAARSDAPNQMAAKREVWLVAMPNAISSGLHAGFPLPLTRADADYWPLYVANVWFGTHRDSFSHLFKVIRADRGYNYGDYSYIEHFESRPREMFPPPNFPRLRQDFSIWIRPVAHPYAQHLLKAMTWELANFARTGLSEEQCQAAKLKARVLYLNLAETAERLLGSRLDDEFYGLKPGYLDSYLEKIGAVRCAEVNAAVRKYLNADRLSYVVVTSAQEAPRLAEAIALDGPAWGKGPSEYQIDSKEEGDVRVWSVPEPKLELLRRDATWANAWLDIPRSAVRIAPAEKMFETSALPR